MGECPDGVFTRGGVGIGGPGLPALRSLTEVATLASAQDRVFRASSGRNDGNDLQWQLLSRCRVDTTGDTNAASGTAYGLADWARFGALLASL